MKTSRLFRLLFCAVVFLLAMVPQSFALRSVGILTREEARERGLELKVSPSGAEAVWVELTFKKEGQLKDYAHVELEVREGDKSLIAYAAMQEYKKSDGAITVRFMVNRNFLEKVTLVVVTGFPSNYSGNEMRLKDFVDLDKVR